MSWQAGRNERLIPRWIITLVVFLPLGVVAWWFLRWFFLPSYERTSSIEIQTPRSRAVRLPVKKDDFQVLKGIGPKTAAALYQARVYSYEQLALMDEEDLVQLLAEHNLPASKVKSWQDQAALAAAEDWEGLEELQA